MKKTSKTVKLGEEVYIVKDNFDYSYVLNEVKIKKETVNKRFGSEYNYSASTREIGGWSDHVFFVGYTTEAEAKEAAIKKLKDYKRSILKFIDNEIKKFKS